MKKVGEGVKMKNENCLTRTRVKQARITVFSGGEHKMREFVQCSIVGKRIKF